MTPLLLRLLLLFALVPMIELFLLLRIGAAIGPTSTILLILVTGLVGASLAKREGLGVLRQLQGELAKGIPPGARLMEGVLVVIGGLLLITPGVFTDVAGVLLILPPTRRWIAPRALAALMRRIDLRTVGGPLPGSPWPTGDVPGADPFGRAAEPSRPTASPRHVGSDPRRAPTPFSSPFDD